jgi:hypothetical protein
MVDKNGNGLVEDFWYLLVRSLGSRNEYSDCRSDFVVITYFSSLFILVWCRFANYKAMLRDNYLQK